MMLLFRRAIPYLQIQNCLALKLFLGSLFILTLWNEYLSYALQSWHWSSLPQSSGKTDQVTVMFAADPQLIGLHNENPNWIGPITRWDSDRYLAKTFRYAFHHVKPDIVIFLGDLLDEGSSASEEDYLTYIERFHDVFSIPLDVQVLYIPGDNDVGGEGFDIRTPEKIRMFNKYFLPGQNPQKDVLNAKFIDFLRIDLPPMVAAAARIQREFMAIRHQSKAQYRVICSHIPIVDRPFNDQNQIIEILGADLIFSAHTHKAIIHTCTDCGPSGANNRHFSYYEGKKLEVKANEIYRMNLNDKTQIYDIQVPTCSYRMGVPQMGYAASTFDLSGQLLYTVLWSPSRYSQLLSYVFMLLLVLLAIIIMVVVTCVKYGVCDKSPCCWFWKHENRFWSYTNNKHKYIISV